MKIHYVVSKNGNKLFSFNRHDYQIDGDTFIDGGFDYIRTNGDVIWDEISNLIEDIRKQFTWTTVLDKNGSPLPKPVYKLLSEMDTDHIINCIYYTANLIDVFKDQNRNNRDIIIISILSAELKYRFENGIL